MKKIRSRVSANNLHFLFAGLTTLFLLAAVHVAHATDKKDVKEELRETFDAIKSYSAEQKDVAAAKARELMDDIDDKIHVWEGKMEDRWSDLKDSSREEYALSKDKIRKMRNDLSEWYGGMKHGSKQAWGEAKEGFLKAYEDIADAIKNQDANS